MLPGCENSEVLRRKISHNNHVHSFHAKVFCFYRDCGAAILSWEGMHRHLFIRHDFQGTLKDAQAAASASANLKSHGQSNTECQETYGNKPTTGVQVGAGDIHSTEYGEKEDGYEPQERSDSMDDCDEDLDDDIIIGEDDIFDGGSEVETLKGAYEIRKILGCVISVRIYRSSLWCKDFYQLMTVCSLSSTMMFGPLSKSVI